MNVEKKKKRRRKKKSSADAKSEVAIADNFSEVPEKVSSEPVLSDEALEKRRKKREKKLRQKQKKLKETEKKKSTINIESNRLAAYGL